VIIEQVAFTIRELKKLGLTILLSEQNLHFAKLVADRAYIIERGSVKYDGTIAELENDEAVRNAYLSV
jgi:branched-chain amino acid transport system ATP-binding protein